MGVGQFKGKFHNVRANFRWKGTSPTNLCWYQNTRVITLSYGIKILAVCSFVLSHVTDAQTNKITIPKTVHFKYWKITTHNWASLHQCISLNDNRHIQYTTSQFQLDSKYVRSQLLTQNVNTVVSILVSHCEGLKLSSLWRCMYVCMRAFIVHHFYSLSSHDCVPKGQTEKMCL